MARRKKTEYRITERFLGEFRLRDWVDRKIKEYAKEKYGINLKLIHLEEARVKIHELDYVLTKSGRKGTIVHIYRNEKDKGYEAYEIEYEGSDGKTDTILPSEIAEVLWRSA